MDEELKQRLKEQGLLPISLDRVTQDEYVKRGEDWTKLETHFTPGTPEPILNLQRKLYEQAECIYTLEVNGIISGQAYNRLTTNLTKNLEQLIFMKFGGQLHLRSFGFSDINEIPPATHSSETIGTVTGSYGANRDPLAYGTPLKDFLGTSGIYRDLLKK